MKKFIIIVVAAMFLGIVFYFTWKFSNYALYDDIQSLNAQIKESREHEEILAQAVKQEQYEIDVITDYIKQK